MRTVDSALQIHLDTGATTLCWLLRIIPDKAAEFGVTSLDVDRTFDDGDGSLTYSASLGLNLSAIETFAGLAVSNAEAEILQGGAFTEEAINAGVFDYAEFKLYRVNWNNLSDGKYTGFTGTFGQVKSNNNLSGIVELRGLAQILKQNFVDLYSITCRAKFASQVGDELFPCNFDDTSLWQNLTVDSVGSETDREFIADGTPAATGPNGALPFDVALVEFLTGNNAGLTVETETVVGADITLRFQSAFDIETGDTFKIRPDCRKRFAEDCIGLYDLREFFRGEPLTPIMEESLSQFPGATIRGLGAPLVTPEPAPYTPPNLEGSVPYTTYFVDLANRTPSSSDRVKIFVPTGGLTLALDIPVTSDRRAWAFQAIPNTDSNGTKQGSVSIVVGDYSAIPRSLDLTNLITIGGVYNAPEVLIGEEDRLLEFIPGQTYFINFMYTDGEANFIDIDTLFSAV